MIYKVSGTLLGSGDQFTRFFELETAEFGKALAHLIRDLSVASWSVEELETAPEDSTFACPHCGEPVRNPALWIT